MKLVLVRHGESEGNVTGRLRGPDSIGDALTPAGLEAARTLGTHLLGLNLPAPRVYASTYRRAQQTAGALAPALGVDVTVLDGVQEVDCGTWVGRPYADLRDHRAEMLGPDGTPAFPGGESASGVAARFRAALAPLLTVPGTPIVVSHGFTLQAALIDVLGVDAPAAWADGRFAHGNAAYTLLERAAGGWDVRRLAVQG